MELNPESERERTVVNLEYLTNPEGEAIAIVIPMEIWRRLLPREDVSFDELQEAVEDYCLNKAMDEAESSSLLTKAEALQYLEE